MTRPIQVVCSSEPSRNYPVFNWYISLLTWLSLRIFTTEFFWKYLSGTCVYCLSAHLSFNFCFCGGYIPCTTTFFVLSSVFLLRFILENVLFHISMLFTYCNISHDISWAAHTYSTWVPKNRKKPYKRVTTFGT